MAYYAAKIENIILFSEWLLHRFRFLYGRERIKDPLEIIHFYIETNA